MSDELERELIIKRNRYQAIIERAKKGPVVDNEVNGLEEFIKIYNDAWSDHVAQGDSWHNRLGLDTKYQNMVDSGFRISKIRGMIQYFSTLQKDPTHEEMMSFLLISTEMECIVEDNQIINYAIMQYGYDSDRVKLYLCDFTSLLEMGFSVENVKTALTIAKDKSEITMGLEQILLNTIAADANLRLPAAAFLDNATITDFPSFLLEVTRVISDEATDDIARQAGAIYLKNTIQAGDSAQDEAYKARWLQVDGGIRDEVKLLLVRTLATPRRQISRNISQCIASIARIEIPRSLWPGMLDTFKHILSYETHNDSLVEAVLESLGYVIEQVGYDLNEREVNEYLTAIISPIQNQTGGNLVKEACLNSLILCIPYLKDVMSKDNDRKFIFSCPLTILHSTDNQDLYYSALDFMTKLATAYYSHFAEFAESYLQIVLRALNTNSDSQTVLYGIEFLSAICDEETERWEDYYYQPNSNNSSPNISSHHGSNSGISEAQPPKLCGRIFPIVSGKLLELLKKEDDHEEDYWCPSQAAAVCLGIYAFYEGDIVAESIYPFLKVQLSVQNTDPYLLESAVMAFGSILKGTSNNVLSKIVSEFMPIVMDIVRAPVLMLQDTAAWAICTVVEHLPLILGDLTAFENLLQLILSGLSLHPRVASHFALALNFISKHAYEQAVTYDERNKPSSQTGLVPSYRMDPYFATTVTQLVQTALRPDATEKNLRQFSCETLIYMFSHTSANCYETLKVSFVTCLTVLAEYITRSKMATSQIELTALSLVQGYFCALISALLSTLEKNDVIPQLEQLVLLLLSILESGQNINQGQSTLIEDAYLTMGSLINLLGDDFRMFYPRYEPILARGISNTAEKTVCIICIGQVSDITSLFGREMLENISQYTLTFIGHLRNPDVDRSIRSYIYAALGDIALVVETLFKALVPASFEALASANDILKRRHDIINSPEDAEYIADLIDNTLDAYQSIIIGIKGDERKITDPETRSYIENQVPIIAELIELVYISRDSSDSQICSCIGILGELISLFGAASIAHFSCLPWFKDLQHEALSSSDVKTRDTVRWLITVINLQKQGTL